MFDAKNRFVINDYARIAPFSSFLPGISGKMGIPIWCFYVNRGQAVAGFGVQDKDHAIMEFYPAHQAYQFTQNVGFRTFLRVDGFYDEPFRGERERRKMFIGMNELEIEALQEDGLQINVLYFTLPGEPLGGLVRKITVANMDTRRHRLEMLDGMPAMIPYGVKLSSIKEMGETSKAWMQVEDVARFLPYYKVRSSMEDSVDVREVSGGHFCFAVSQEGKKLPVIVDPHVVFDYDTSFTKAIGFDQMPLSKILEEPQVTENNLPCGFFGMERILEPGQAFCVYEAFGQAESRREVKAFSEKCSPTYFERKYAEAAALAEDLCRPIRTRTASPLFDAYCRQTYLDNVLRGGCPILLGKDRIYYLYSRKHGDLERDYNFFSVPMEFYSQGNANFRDLNQNRRCDVMFSPFVKDENIKMFYNLIQLDGYNPLLIQKVTYRLPQDNIAALKPWLCDSGAFERFVKEEFTPGELLKFAGKTQAIAQDRLEEFLGKAVELSHREINAEFGEGFWSDHWTYNLDLIETYLSVYPEREEYLLFQDRSYTYFDSGVFVNPRGKRYAETARGVRQYRPLDGERKKRASKTVRMRFGQGEIYQTVLMEKLLLLCAVKFATLDPYGMGIEMEAGKPGWYDALNGLPGIFGSSMAETCELARLLDFVIQRFQTYPQNIRAACEIAALFLDLDQATGSEWEGISSWNAVNELKEQYREKTADGVSGETVILSAAALLPILRKWLQIVQNGIQRAVKSGNGICPTYFRYDVVSYQKREENIIPLEFSQHMLPYFLEGPVHWLKIPADLKEKCALYQKLKASSLYDKKLAMYKVSESLHNVPFEVGRVKAFTPGWLENESIWLHMEYKYFLELLKSGLYKEFFEDFRNGLVPFMDEAVYGRSTLENSSFLASSVNPNPRIRGKGFVARLSGSTAEFIHIWQIMLFGSRPFRRQKEGTVLALEPAIPAYLIPENLTVECTFLGRVAVVYHVPERKDYIPGQYSISVQKVCYQDEEREDLKGAVLPKEVVGKIRAGKVKKILVELM